MVKLNERQARVLADLEEVAAERHTLKEQVAAKMREIEAELYSDYDEEMTEAISAAKNAGVPTRQIGLAYGSKDYRTAMNLVEKYWKLVDPTEPTPTPKNETEPTTESEV